MSHGLVNNVFRSHSNAEAVAMVSYIPAVVSHPVLRTKCVLHIMDATRGVWEGGPFGRKADWLWDHNALLLATDPVAMDHVELDYLNKKRGEMGAAPTQDGEGRLGSLQAGGLRHPPAPVHRHRRPARAGQLRLQVAPREGLPDPAHGEEDLLTAVLRHQADPNGAGPTSMSARPLSVPRARPGGTRPPRTQAESRARLQCLASLPELSEIRRVSGSVLGSGGFRS